MIAAPKPGDTLSDESGDMAIVVGDDWSVLDALVELVIQHYGWDGDIESLRRNPVLMGEAGRRKIETWWSCTAAWREAEGIDLEGLGCASFWAANGDGRRSIEVVSIGESASNLGERCEEALHP